MSPTDTYRCRQNVLLFALYKKIDSVLLVRNLDYCIKGLDDLLLASNGRGGCLTSVLCFVCGRKIIGHWSLVLIVLE